MWRWRAEEKPAGPARSGGKFSFSNQAMNHSNISLKNETGKWNRVQIPFTITITNSATNTKCPLIAAYISHVGLHANATLRQIALFDIRISFLDRPFFQRSHFLLQFLELALHHRQLQLRLQAQQQFRSLLLPKPIFLGYQFRFYLCFQFINFSHSCFSTEFWIFELSNKRKYNLHEQIP